MTLNPSYTDAWSHLADCNSRMGEFELALNYLLKAEELEKNNGAIENLKGMIFLALGRSEEAREIFNKILKTYPNDVNAHFGLAELELYDGKFSGAEQQYTFHGFNLRRNRTLFSGRKIFESGYAALFGGRRGSLSGIPDSVYAGTYFPG